MVFRSKRGEGILGSRNSMCKDPECGWTVGYIWDGDGGEVGKMSRSQMMIWLHAMFEFSFYPADNGILAGLFVREWLWELF